MSETEAFYCRLCATLKPKPDLVFIKKDRGINRKIYDKVLECFHLDIEDAFSSYVCPDCWVQASSMYDLYEKVLQAQDILRNINQANVQVNEINPMNVKKPTIRVETEEAAIDAVDVRQDNQVEFGQQSYSDLDNVQGKCQL